MILNVRVRTVDGERNLARNIPRLIFRIIQSSAIDCSIDYVAYRLVTKVFVVFNTYVGSDCMKIYVPTPVYPYGALIPTPNSVVAKVVFCTRGGQNQNPRRRLSPRQTRANMTT